MDGVLKTYMQQNHAVACDDVAVHAALREQHESQRILQKVFLDCAVVDQVVPPAAVIQSGNAFRL
jgi:hypothetical protein